MGFHLDNMWYFYDHFFEKSYYVCKGLPEGFICHPVGGAKEATRLSMKGYMPCTVREFVPWSAREHVLAAKLNYLMRRRVRIEPK